MAKSKTRLEWCTVRLGEDVNWWVHEISDDVQWDIDGLSIIDPRQVAHIIDLIEPLRDYGFEPDVMDRAFIPFRIDKDLGKGFIRLVRTKESILESEDKLFALPDVMDDENGPYADFLDHVTKLRVKMLNDVFDFEQKLTVDEVEEEIREGENNEFIEGKAVHLFTEICAILDYVPSGWEIDDEEDGGKKAAEEEDDFPDIEDAEGEEELKDDKSLRWDEEEEEDDFDEDLEEEDGDDLGDDDEEEEEEEEGLEDEEESDKPPRRRG